MWRAGFGPAAAQLEQFTTLDPRDLYKALQKGSSKDPVPFDVADHYLKGLMMGIDDTAKNAKRSMDAEEKRNVARKQRESIRNLNLYWIKEMVSTQAQLREKMAFFWHGHFASRNINIFYQQQLLDIIRRNALGSFRDLLHQTSKSAAILNFLNAQQNKKGRPNENFAREVMELFTLGRGNYTEKDVKDAARAFTGWSANAKGDFIFRKFQHDTDTKTVLGKTGNLGGEDVLDHLLAQQQTALFITSKIYRFFVNDIIDNKKVEWLADRFYKSNYHIAALLEDIFTSEWFYEEKNIGTKIKSPVELIAGMQRMLPMEIKNEDAILLLQRVLGQVLFYPPNVAGWPGGRTWIDSSTLMMRMRIPQLINDQDEMNVRPKIDDDQMMGRTDNPEMTANAGKPKRGYGKVGKPIEAVIDWPSYIKPFDNIGREQLLSALQNALYQVKPAFKDDMIKTYADSSSRESFIRTVTLQLMSTPEYQMC